MSMNMRLSSLEAQMRKLAKENEELKKRIKELEERLGPSFIVDGRLPVTP